MFQEIKRKLGETHLNFLDKSKEKVTHIKKPKTKKQK